MYDSNAHDKNWGHRSNPSLENMHVNMSVLSCRVMVWVVLSNTNVIANDLYDGPQFLV